MDSSGPAFAESMSDLSIARVVGILYLQKVKVRFQNNERVPGKFWKLITEYGRHSGSITEVGFFQEVQELFIDNVDIFEEFTQMLFSDSIFLSAKKCTSSRRNRIRKANTDVIVEVVVKEQRAGTSISTAETSEILENMAQRNDFELEAPAKVIMEGNRLLKDAEKAYTSNELSIKTDREEFQMPHKKKKIDENQAQREEKKRILEEGRHDDIDDLEENQETEDWEDWDLAARDIPEEWETIGSYNVHNKEWDFSFTQLLPNYNIATIFSRE